MGRAESHEAHPRSGQEARSSDGAPRLWNVCGYILCDGNVWFLNEAPWPQVGLVVRAVQTAMRLIRMTNRVVSVRIVKDECQVLFFRARSAAQDDDIQFNSFPGRFQEVPTCGAVKD